MFKTLGEKKRQLDNFRRLQKAIDGVVVHSENDFVDICVNCSFEITNLKIKENFFASRDISLNIIEKSIIDAFNKAKLKAQQVLQEKSKENFK